MNEQEIINKYQRITAAIEDRFSNTDLPMDVQIFYLVAELIKSQSFKRFHQRYGGIFLDPDFADAGKQEWLNLPPLTDFERESCILWNRYCSELDRKTIAPPGY